MEIEVKVNQYASETIRIDHSVASYGIFCFNTAGDLFLSSDWGFYGYAWRGYGADTFKRFLSQCEDEYIVGKFELNFRQTTNKKLPIHTKQMLLTLTEQFIKALKKEVGSIYDTKRSL